jgi:hypothetical protein
MTFGYFPYTKNILELQTQRKYRSGTSMLVFCVVTPLALNMEAACTATTLVSSNKFTRRYNPEDKHRHLDRRENFKSYTDLGCPPIRWTEKLFRNFSQLCFKKMASSELECSLVEVYQPFRGACCLHHQGDEDTIHWVSGFSPRGKAVRA